MINKSTRERLLASSMICGAAFMAMSATTAYAQDDVAVEEIVVTGSRIARPDLVSTSPVATVGEQDLKQSGVVNTENLLNTLPQAVPGVTSTVNNGSGGAATVNLRGLGSNRTLVLVDGKRQTPTTQAGTVDLNLIPTALIQSVEVVTGGASAVYGSDAIAGVVNFVLKKDFEGFQFNAGYQNTDDLDAPIYSIDATIGANFDDGRGNVVLSLGYNDREPLTQGKRGGLMAQAYGEPSAAQRAAGITGLVPSGSGSQEDGTVGGFATGALVTIPGVANNVANTGLFTADGSVRLYNAASDTYNFAPINYLQTPQERYSVTALGRYELAPGIEAFAKGNFVYSAVTTQLAETPVGNRIFRFSLDNNPFLSAAGKRALNSLASTASYTIPNSSAWAAGTYADVDANGNGIYDTVTGVFNRRLTEVGPRINEFNFYGFQTQLGLRGDLNFINGSWETYIQYGNTHGSQSLLGDTSLQRIQQGLLLNAAGTGCLDPSNGCVPVNLFGRGKISAAAANFIKTRIESSQDYEQLVASAFFSGNTDNFFTLPAGGLGFAIGSEYRYEGFAFRPSQDLAVGNLTGFNASPPVSGDFDVYELYGELLVPLLKDLPFAQSVNLELAGRLSDYSSQDKITKTYKVAGDWEVFDDLRLRASYNRAVRAPSVGELFAPQGNGFPTSTDPCSAPGFANLSAGAAAQRRQACLNAGVPAAAIGVINANQQTQTLTGGNPNLAPEVADTLTIGAVYQPSFIPRLAITVDWFDIQIDDQIASFGGSTQNVFNICYGASVNGNPSSPYCSAIRRLANGSIDFVSLTNQNVASNKVQGLDIGVSYRFDLADLGLPDAGGISIKSLYTNTWKSTFQADEISAPLKCADRFGPSCGNPTPRHKVRTAINWSYENYGLNLVWSYLDDVYDDNAAVRVVEKVGIKNYFDLSADWRATDTVSFTGGVRNLTQEKYPIMGANASPSNNGYPATYDVLGRMFFINASLKY
ncbi:TonB-dependent receptor [Caulobacter segnis]|uniref:TonB-dependent receptor plug domain-containing protein n=1 Tax=Caulobacter segnis TaxID=88688 RepID=UPI00240FBA12|nr:TonB-dependent receptor [Caulobacter segnis]MDG2523372.1 TonB-dependent receptor [Caulobacter segnis]